MGFSLKGFTNSIFPGVTSLLGGGSQQQTNTTTNEPWAAMQPYMRDVFAQGQGLYNSSGGLASLSPETRQAQGLYAQRAQTGSPITGAAQGLAGSILRGEQLDPNNSPYFSGGLNSILGDVKGQLNSQFRGNNYGTSAHQEWLSKGLTNAAAPYFQQSYENNLNRQYGLLSQAPDLANMDYGDIGILSTLGAQKDARAQAERDAPWANLQRYQQAIGGFGNPGSTTNTPYHTNPTGELLGNAANLAVLGKMLGFLSDRRLKKDIEKVGEREDGLNVYEFRFTWDKDDQPKRVGLMADEVKGVYPDAVGDFGGFATVDYSRLLK
jgi:hypothetical protein